MVASESVYVTGSTLAEMPLRQSAVDGSSRQTFPPDSVSKFYK